MAWRVCLCSWRRSCSPSCCSWEGAALPARPKVVSKDQDNVALIKSTKVQSVPGTGILSENDIPVVLELELMGSSNETLACVTTLAPCARHLSKRKARDDMTHDKCDCSFGRRTIIVACCEVVFFGHVLHGFRVTYLCLIMNTVMM